MSRIDTIGTHKTTVFSSGGYTHVVYHNTRVVSFNSKYLILRTGGYHTKTTKLRMNQTSRQFALDYAVYQEGWTWYVEVSSLVTYSFHEDGNGEMLTIDRSNGKAIPQDNCGNDGYPFTN